MVFASNTIASSLHPTLQHPRLYNAVVYISSAYVAGGVQVSHPLILQAIEDAGTCGTAASMSPKIVVIPEQLELERRTMLPAVYLSMDWAHSPQAR